MTTKIKNEDASYLKNLLTDEDGNWSEMGGRLIDELIGFEGPFSPEAIDGAAKELHVSAEELLQYFEENPDDKELVLQEQINALGYLISEFRRLTLDVEDDWKINKALKVVRDKKNERQKMSEEYCATIDGFAEKLKSKPNLTDKEFNAESKQIRDVMKKYNEYRR